MKIDGFLLPVNPFINADESLGSSSIGLFGYEELGSNSNGFVCLKFSSLHKDYLIDAPWKAAQAFAIIANICSGLVLCFLIMTSCYAISPIALKCLSGLSFFASFTVMFTFLIFASIVGDDPFNGSFYYGGAMTILGCILCFVTGLLILQIQPPGSHNYIVRDPDTTTTPTNVTTRGSTMHVVPPPPQHKRNFAPAKRIPKSNIVPKESARDIEAFAPGTETVTETILPDGTKKVVTTTIGMDGSTTITETIVRKE